MPRQPQSVAITFANTGIVLRSSPDEIPLTSYKALVNVITDRENTISVRRGFVRLNNGLPSEPYSCYYLQDANGTKWRYAIAGGKLYVAPVENPNDPDIWPLSLGTDFAFVPGGDNLASSGEIRPIWATYSLHGYESKPYVFLADGTAFLKHAGGMNAARRIGIPKPTKAMTVSVEPNDYVTIDSFESTASWSEDNSTVESYDRIGTGDAMSITITGEGATGGAYRKFTSGSDDILLELGQDDLDEAIEIWIKFDSNESANNCKEIIISFGLSETPGDVTFSTRFEKAISPSIFESASQAGSLGRGSSYSDLISSGIDPLTQRNVSAITNEVGDYDPSKIQDLVSQISGAQPVIMPPGSQVWNVLRIKKSEFIRIGTSGLTAPELSWDTVSAMRIDIKNKDSVEGSGNCTIGFDDCVLLTTGKLFGVDLAWTYTYYNSNTDTESDYGPITDVPYPGASFDQFRLSFPICPGITPPAADPDKIRIYRRGGTISQFSLVDSIDYTPGVKPSDYIDNVPDDLLGQQLDTDNQLPPVGVEGIAIYDDRLWTWGGYTVSDDGSEIPEPPNRLRFSKAVRIEHFPSDSNYVLVGNAADKIVRCLEADGELFVFTTNKVYRIVGSDGNYRAVGTPINQGLVSKHGIARGLRSVYLQSYDGIYEFPSGKKLTEPINQVFMGDYVNEIPPIEQTRRSECSIAHWDNKIYFSYPRTSGAGITNDAMLVWDIIYERWHWYLYGARYLFAEPDTNILVGCGITQWDSFKDGVPDNISYGGAWPMRLEYGFYDQCSSGNRGIFWAVDTKDYDLGMPDQEKRLIDMVVDADSQGGSFGVQMAFDMRRTEVPYGPSEYETIGTVQTIGRERVILPIPLGTGSSSLATRFAIRLLGKSPTDAVGATRIYKIIHRVLVEPPRHRTHVTEWSDYGVPGPKFFRELWVDLDTFGYPLDSIEVQIDQEVAYTISPVEATNGQTRLYFGLPIDLRGSLARIKLVPTGTNELKLYDHSFQVMAEPPLVNTLQTPWSDEGWPYPKLWKEVLLDIDTDSMQMTANFWLDGSVVHWFNVVTRNGRQRLTYSLPKDLIGKLGRITISTSHLDPIACEAQGVRIYGVYYLTDKQPADVTFADSYEQLFSYPRIKVLRRMWIAIKNPDADVTMSIYCDEVLKYRHTITSERLASGFSKRRIDIPSSVKGRLFRIIFESTFPFQIYWDKSEWEIKDLNSEDGYRRELMSPPQTM